jgi:hypothetical protein
MEVGSGEWGVGSSVAVGWPCFRESFEGGLGNSAILVPGVSDLEEHCLPAGTGLIGVKHAVFAGLSPFGRAATPEIHEIALA